MQPTLDVAAVLAELGIVVTKEVGGELYALCPGHERRTGKPDTHASWSMNERSFVHHCFSCGYSGSLQGLYMDLTGEVPDDLTWQITKASVQNSSFAQLAPEDLPEVAPDPDPEEEKVDLSDWAYNRYVDVPDRLLELRHLRRDAVDTYGVKWDKPNHRWVIPVLTPEGERIGYQFRQKGVELNLPKGMEKSGCLFGFHVWETTANKITIVESPLDAVRMWSAGIPCVSSYGAYVSDAQLTLLARNFKTVICAMDNDGPGWRANGYIERQLKGKCNTWVMDWALLATSPSTKMPKDPGDIEDDGVLRTVWDMSQSLNELLREAE